MDSTLKSILEKLARERSAASFTDADFAYLTRVVGEPEQNRDDEPAPLWRFIRKNTLLFRNVFNYYLDAELDPILLDAGAAEDSLKGYAQEPRMCARIKRDALKRSVARHLTHERPSVRAHAARLVGLLELDDMADVLADSLSSGREERRDYGMPVIAASLEALTMLEHPQVRALAARYVAHEDWTLRRSAQAAVLVAEGVPSDEEFRRIFDSQIDWSLLGEVPDALVAAAKSGALGEDLVEQMVNYAGTVTVLATVADIIVSAEWKEMFQRLMSHYHPDLRAALAVRVAWSKCTWCKDALVSRLDEEDAEDVRMCIVTALATIGDGDLSFLRARLQSDDIGDKLGATWATTGTGRFAEELMVLARDSDPKVCRAALAALSVNGTNVDASQVELAFTDLLNNEDQWWPWALPVAGLVATGAQLPICADAFRYVSSDVGRLTEKKLERALEIFRAHPLQLLRWLRADTPHGQRLRAIAFAGLSEHAAFDDALEHALLSAELLDLAVAAALEVVAGRGPSSKAAELKTRIALFEQPKAPDDALLPTIVHSFVGLDSQLRKRAISCLASYGSVVEPYLSMLIGSLDPEVARSAADAVAQLSAPRDPMLADVAKLLAGDARKLSDLTSLDRLVLSLSPRVRHAVAELGSVGDVPREPLLRAFSFLVADRDPDVAAAALGALAVQAGEEKWVKDLILAHTWSQDWRTREKAIGAMAQIGDPMFVSRMLEILAEEQEGPMKDSAVRGLEAIAESHPQLGLVVLDIRDPNRVATRFALNEQVNWEADRHTEGLRLLMLGLDRRKEHAQAKKHVARKVMITSATDADAAHGHTAWSAKDLDALVLYLRVVYTDEESGAIVAEVAEDATGEVLSAMLQSTSVAVYRAAWS